MTTRKTAGKKAAAKSAPGKKIAPKQVSPFRRWADRPDDAAISELCQQMVEGGHLAGFCKAREFAYVTVLDWINADPRRTELYARAREDRADLLADETIAIADEEVTMVKRSKHQLGISDEGEDGEVEVVFDPTAVARNRLRVDARKWYAAKLKPRRYGDKLHTELTGKDGKDLPVAPAGVLVVPGILHDTAAWSAAVKSATLPTAE